MGERTPGLGTNVDTRHDPPTSRAVAKDLGSEIATVRAELDTLLGELDRRRHEALDVPLQLRRHAFGASLTVVAFVATAAGSVWLTLWRRRRRERPAAQAGRLRHALSRMTEHPERVATETSVTTKILTAAANAAMAVLVKKALERGVERLMDTTPQRGADTDDRPRPPVRVDRR
jgi:hypothetical protein